MKLSRPCLFKKVSSFLLWTILICLSLASSSPVLALTPGELIVVYNRNLVESKAVAEYYAQRRRVPWANLVEVAVTTAEQMSRQEYEQKLLPPVRTAVKKLQAQGKTPALLLVYGLPLRVLGPPETEADRAFQTMATAKVTEYRDLVGQMLRELDAITGAPAWASPALTYPTGHLLEKAAAAINQAVQFLKTRPEKQESPDPRARAYSLLIRLTGVAPEARLCLKKQAKAPPLEPQGFKDQELLLWYSALRRDLEAQMFRGVLPETAMKAATTIRLANGVLGELKFWEEVSAIYRHPETAAALDRELTLAILER